MDTIREFMVSSSGLAPVRRGIALGWVISVLSGVAILLGAREAEARTCWWECHGAIPEECPEVDKPIYCNKWCKEGGNKWEAGDGCFA